MTFYQQAKTLRAAWETILQARTSLDDREELFAKLSEVADAAQPDEIFTDELTLDGEAIPKPTPVMVLGVRFGEGLQSCTLILIYVLQEGGTTTYTSYDVDCPAWLTQFLDKREGRG